MSGDAGKTREELLAELQALRARVAELEAAWAQADRADAGKTSGERELERIADSVLRNIPSGIFIYRYEAPDKLWLLGGNPEAERLTGLRIEEHIGREFDQIWPAAREAGVTDAYLAAIHSGQVFETEDLYYEDKRLSGAFRIRAFRIPQDYLIVAFENITERKQAEEQIRASLKEKEVLLREVHHRVKNNLEVISSLLDFQAEYTGDEHAVAALRESQRRVRAMAMIHEQLYRPANLSQIDMAAYVDRLAADLYVSYHIDPGRVRLQVDVQDVFLEVQKAVPCGLIINELISNAFKHAFPRGRGDLIQPQEVRLSLGKTAEGRCRLWVRDNGVGLPADFHYPSERTLGLFLIDTFVQQIKGGIEWHSNRGTECAIEFDP